LIEKPEEAAFVVNNVVGTKFEEKTLFNAVKN